MRSKDCHGSHLRAFLTRMKMVDGDNAGERGVMVARGHGLYVSFCVCGETTKNRLDLKKVNASWSLEHGLGLATDTPC